ncbi:hypothetical protein HK096_006580 [Nowakowskiella sp. JEL0078]|nr:hypothetical protein HK096_006580 [Nowakowskiella sp. JEL0078]
MAEYILHHVPLMAVLGLSDSAGNSSQNEISISSSATIPPPPLAMNVQASQSSAKKALLTALTAKNNSSIWDSAGKQPSFFYVVPVDKNHIFPARKQTPMGPRSVATVISSTNPNPILPQGQNSTLSAFSPTNPNSPLYPDGIMTTLWVKKHREDMPSVIVGFFELWERTEPLDRRDPIALQYSLNLERERDLILCSEINEKRRHALDRGIKFSIVLMLKMIQTDDHMEERIAFIRKTCSLETKSSLFVLPLISKDASPIEFSDFVNNLQTSLFELAVNYYREHVKRTKKKKLKIQSIAPISRPSLASMPQNSTLSKPLSPQGWNVRYDFKMAIFSEFAQDLELAVKFYGESYSGLIDMVQSSLQTWGGIGSQSTGDLQPYSNRWLEARTLLDALNLKVELICKLYLFTDFPVLALMQLNRHIDNLKVLPEFSGPPPQDTTAITTNQNVELLGQVPGGGSCEYWSWALRQYRGFGELIEIAVSKTGLKVPFPPPGTTPTSTTTITAQQLLATNTSTNLADGSVTAFGPLSSSNSMIVVQHAGFYYLIAARCAEERWKRSKIPTLQQIRPPSFDVDFQSPSTLLLPHDGLFEPINDHPSVIVELLTKAYEHFKKQKSSRTTLFIASEIARIYEESGKYDMAFKFFERIAKTYRKENWASLLVSVLESSIRSAKLMGMWNSVVEALVETLSEKLTPYPDDRSNRWIEILDILSTKRPVIVAPQALQQTPESSPRHSLALTSAVADQFQVNVNMDHITSFLTCTVQFQKSNTFIGSPMHFQITIASETLLIPTSPKIRIQRLRIQFSDPRFDHVFIDDGTIESDSEYSPYQLTDCTNCTWEVAGSNAKCWTKKIDLSFVEGCKRVFEGVVAPTEPMDVKIVAVTMVVERLNSFLGNENAMASLSLCFNISERVEDLFSKRKWLNRTNDNKLKFVVLDGSGEQSTLRVIRRQPNLGVKFLHEPPGYLEEIYVVTVCVSNEENEDMIGYIDIDFRASGADIGDPTSLLSTDANSLSRLIQSSKNSDTEFEGRISQVGVSPLSGRGPPPIATYHNGVAGIELGKIQAGQSVNRHFWISGIGNTGERVVFTTVHYQIITGDKTGSSGTEELYYRKNESLRISFVKPFELYAEFTRQTRLPLNDAGVGGILGVNGLDGDFSKKDNWLALLALKNIGPWDVEIKNLSLEEKKEVYEFTKVLVLPIVPIETGISVWKIGQVTNYVYKVVVESDVLAEEKIGIGSISFSWKRIHKNSSLQTESHWTRSVIGIPKLNVTWEHVRIIVDMPADAKVGHMFPAKYILQNISMEIIELSAVVEVAEGFVFSGYKSMTIKLLPLSTKHIIYNILPLIGGRCSVPHLKFTYKSISTAATPAKIQSPNSDLTSTPIISTPGSTTTTATSEPAVSEISVMSLRGNIQKSDGDLTIFVRPFVGW